MYESPFILFKVLRINSTKKFMQTASRYILSERFYWSQLWTPVLPSYTEVGYGIGKFAFELFQWIDSGRATNIPLQLFIPSA